LWTYGTGQVGRPSPTINKYQAWVEIQEKVHPALPALCLIGGKCMAYLRTGLLALPDYTRWFCRVNDSTMLRFVKMAFLDSTIEPPAFPWEVAQTCY